MLQRKLQIQTKKNSEAKVWITYGLKQKNRETYNGKCFDYSQGKTC